MNVLIGLLVLLVLYICIKIYRAGKVNTIRKHGHCCDECSIRDLCDEYEKKKYKEKL